MSKQMGRLPIGDAWLNFLATLGAFSLFPRVLAALSGAPVELPFSVGLVVALVAALLALLRGYQAARAFPPPAA